MYELPQILHLSGHMIFCHKSIHFPVFSPGSLKLGSTGLGPIENPREGHFGEEGFHN